MRRTITQQWIEEVRAALKRQGESQNAIAKKVGATSAAISILLAGKQQSSKLVEPISKLLGIELPPLSAHEPKIEQLAKICDELDPEDVEILLATARRMSGSK